MKRRSDLSRRYMIYRIVPFFEPVESSSDLSIDTRLILKTINLERPKMVRFIGGKVLKVIQKIPKEQCKNEFWILDTLKKEASQLFKGFQVKDLIIVLEYE